MNNFKGRFSVSAEDIGELLGVPPEASIIYVGIDPETGEIIFTLSTPKIAEGFWSIPEFGSIPQTFVRLRNLVANLIARKLGVVL